MRGIEGGYFEGEFSESQGDGVIRSGQEASMDLLPQDTVDHLLKVNWESAADNSPHSMYAAELSPLPEPAVERTFYHRMVNQLRHIDVEPEAGEDENIW